MALFQPYKGTGTPPVIIEDGNIYFNLTDKTILVDHNNERYTFFGTDTNTHLITSVNGKTGAVNLTYSDVGAASSSHTHTAAQVGAAAADHTHTPESIGAAAANHTHTPASIGAATSDHTHTLASLGAAASNHSHTPASIGAAAASHTHSRSQITGIPNIYSKLLWDNSSPGSTYAQGQLTNFSVTDSTIANNYPIFLAMRFWTSTDSDAGMGIWFIFPKRSNNTYMDDYNETWGFTTGRYYYGRRAASNTITNDITYTATSSGGSGNFSLGQGYRNNDAGAKWCIPGQILGIYAIN